MSKKKQKRQKSIGDISPAQYREFLSKVQIAELSLKKVSSEIFKEKFLPENKPTVSISDSYNITSSDKNIKIESSFELKVTVDKSEEIILFLNALHEIILIPESKFPSPFWNIYKSATLPLKIWPYFRELVQNITSRMNIPPLTLPILYK